MKLRGTLLLIASLSIISGIEHSVYAAEELVMIENECPTCFDELESTKENPVCTLACHKTHRFHQQCLRDIVAAETCASACPTCKEPFADEDMARYRLKEIECGICYTSTMEGFALPCDPKHEFCVDCLRQMVDQGRHQLKCPQCRYPLTEKYIREFIKPHFVGKDAPRFDETSPEDLAAIAHRINGPFGQEPFNNFEDFNAGRRADRQRDEEERGGLLAAIREAQFDEEEWAAFVREVHLDGEALIQEWAAFERMYARHERDQADLQERLLALQRRAAPYRREQVNILPIERPAQPREEETYNSNNYWLSKKMLYGTLLGLTGAGAIWVIMGELGIVNSLSYWRGYYQGKDFFNVFTQAAQKGSTATLTTDLTNMFSKAGMYEDTVYKSNESRPRDHLRGIKAGFSQYSLLELLTREAVPSHLARELKTMHTRTLWIIDDFEQKINEATVSA